MHKLVSGIHHITALASDPQKNLDFYAGVLGLRLVKKTVNFDAPDVYHLYYGNEVGSPGTILTFFPYPGIPKGRKGNGQLAATAFSIPHNSLDYWLERLKKSHVVFQEPLQRFGEWVIPFEDHEGLGLELVARSNDKRPAFSYGNVSLEHAIRGFYGITLSEECVEKTAALLAGEMNYSFFGEEGNRHRYATGDANSGFVDLLCSPDSLKGISGAGTIHHVAFATDNETTQIEAREKLLNFGLNVTPILDRQYFHSIYFREPGGVLFEIATLSPGFLIDETKEHLGETLKLPPWEERHRAQIERRLIPIHLDFQKATL